jgi:hypothetical protein
VKSESDRPTAQLAPTPTLAAGVRTTNGELGFVAVCFDGPSDSMSLYR